MIKNNIINSGIFRFAVMIFCVILATVMCNAESFAATGTTKPLAKGTTTKAATVYASPSSSSSKVKSLTKGKTFQIDQEKFITTSSTASKYKWYYSAAYKGYIRSDYVNFAEKTTVTGTITEAVNVRTGAGWSYGKKTVYNEGKSVKVVLTSYDKNDEKWYKIKVGSAYYYVIARYVKLSTTASSGSSSAASEATKSTTTTTTTTTTKRSDEPSPKSATGTVTASNGVVRKSMSTSAAKVTTLKKGATARVSSTNYTSATSTDATTIWYYLPEYKGYVRSDRMSLSCTKVYAWANADVNIRKGAGIKFSSLKKIAKGKKVKMWIIARDTKRTKWVRVQVGDTVGYVKLSRLTNTKPKTSSTTTTVTGFPASYTKILNKLKKNHPNWEFVAVNTGLDWNDAVNHMTSNSGANLVYTTFQYSYRSTQKGCYNYLKDTYTPKDGAKFVAASKKCVKFYMDPRNWLDDSHIFMFEDNRYHSAYQTRSMVKTIIKGRNSHLYTTKNLDAFMTAAKNYNISPVYLASKAIEEQGSGINSGTISGKKVYNVFNIGANDSASGGAYNGLKFARNGSSYLRPWTSISLAIRGGAKYIANNFIANNQSCAYLEHFNVLNGLSKVGTHVYMTAVYAPRNTSVTTANSYKKYGIYNKKIVFYIPVYENMPESACAVPSSSWKKDNNFYLKTLSVTAGGKTYKKITSSSLNYTKSFTIYVNSSVSSAKISATAASKTGATISGKGTKTLAYGTNTFKVKCKASSGETRTYTIKIVRG